MGKLIKIDFKKLENKKDTNYRNKLVRIRDEIEDYLNLVSRNENDELAIALAAGRFATMKLTQLTGEIETKKFVNECIITTLKK
jgi:transcription elongation GreA/GreB family factor